MPSTSHTPFTRRSIRHGEADSESGKVYTYEYTNLLVPTLENCPIAGVGVTTFTPYFPLSATTSTPDSCSCDIFFDNPRYRSSSNYAPTCWNKLGATQADHDECYCCAASECVSSYAQPSHKPHPPNQKTNPRNPPASTTSAPTQPPNPSPSSPPSLTPSSASSKPPPAKPSPPRRTSTPCARAWTSTAGRVAGAQFVTPADLPANGSAPVSATPGSATSPVGGAALVWSFASGQEYAAAALSGSAASSTASGQGTGGTTAASVAGGLWWRGALLRGLSGMWWWFGWLFWCLASACCELNVWL